MNKKIIIISVISVTIILLMSVLVIGGAKHMDKNQKEIELNQKKTELSNQREAALIIKRKEPSASKVVFTNEGYHPGVGLSWSIGAEVTIDNEIFNVFLDLKTGYTVNFGPDMDKANRYDEIHSRKIETSNPLVVIYSDGNHEVLK